MANLTGFMRSRLALRQQPPDGHPEAELLSAFAEGALSVPARTIVMAHLERCAECREILVLSMPESGPTLAPIEQRRPAVGRFWQWSAAAAIAGLLLAFVLTPRSPSPAQPKMASQPPASVALEGTMPPVPQSKMLAPTKSKTTTAAGAGVAPPVAEVPLLETPPLVAPRLGFQGLGFQSVDTANLSESSAQAAVKRLVDTSVARPGRNSVWRIEENGTLSKSLDGKTWIAVQVDQQTRLYALSVDGAEIWTGGTRGNLFHSTDDGTHWRQVEVHGPGGVHLTNSITKIDFTPQRPVALTTDTGAVWVSFDGRLWHQQ
jgi:hypothetical protein